MQRRLWVFVTSESGADRATNSRGVHVASGADSAGDDDLHRIAELFADVSGYTIIDRWSTDESPSRTLQFSISPDAAEATLAALKARPEVLDAWLGDEFND